MLTSVEDNRSRVQKLGVCGPKIWQGRDWTGKLGKAGKLSELKAGFCVEEKDEEGGPASSARPNETKGEKREGKGERGRGRETMHERCRQRRPQGQM